MIAWLFINAVYIFVVLGIIGVWIGSAVCEENEIFGIFIILPSIAWTICWAVPTYLKLFCSSC